jgi:hypothetical protein
MGGWMGQQRSTRQRSLMLAAAREPAAPTRRWQRAGPARAVRRDRMLAPLICLLTCSPRTLLEPVARTKTARRRSLFALAINARSAPTTTIASEGPDLPARPAAFALPARQTRTAKAQPRPATLQPINAWVVPSGATVQVRAKLVPPACALRRRTKMTPLSALAPATPRVRARASRARPARPPLTA